MLVFAQITHMKSRLLPFSCSFTQRFPLPAYEQFSTLQSPGWDSHPPMDFQILSKCAKRNFTSSIAQEHMETAVKADYVFFLCNAVIEMEGGYSGLVCLVLVW